MLTWIEEAHGDVIGTAAHQPTTKRGFGSVLVETSVRQLRGEMTSVTTDRSFALTMRLPVGVVRRD